MVSGSGAGFGGRVERREQSLGDRDFMTHGTDAGWYSKGSRGQRKYLKGKRIWLFLYLKIHSSLQHELWIREET